jgi:hypothetical protein
MPTRNLTPQIINAAIFGFEEQKRHIDTQIAELRAMLPGGRAEPAATPEAPKRKRKLSAAGKRAIVEATKKRWAAFHAAKAAEKHVVAKKGAAKKVTAKKTAVRVAAKKTATKKPQKKAASAPEGKAAGAAQ